MKLSLPECQFSPTNYFDRELKNLLENSYYDGFTSSVMEFIQTLEKLPVIPQITNLYPTNRRYSQYKHLPYGEVGTISTAGYGPLLLDYSLKVLGFSIPFENIVDECVVKGYRCYILDEHGEIVGGAGSEYDLPNVALSLFMGEDIISALQKGQIVTILISNEIYHGDKSRKGNHFITLIGIDEEENAIFMDGDLIVKPDIPEAALVRKPFRRIALGIKRAWAWDPEKVMKFLIN